LHKVDGKSLKVIVFQKGMNRETQAPNSNDARLENENDALFVCKDLLYVHHCMN
jgi:hypothetical protein